MCTFDAWPNDEYPYILKPGGTECDSGAPVYLRLQFNDYANFTLQYYDFGILFSLLLVINYLLLMLLLTSINVYIVYC